MPVERSAAEQASFGQERVKVTFRWPRMGVAVTGAISVNVVSATVTVPKDAAASPAGGAAGAPGCPPAMRTCQVPLGTWAKLTTPPATIPPVRSASTGTWAPAGTETWCKVTEAPSNVTLPAALEASVIVTSRVARFRAKCWSGGVGLAWASICTGPLTGA